MSIQKLVTDLVDHVINAHSRNGHLSIKNYSGCKMDLNEVLDKADNMYDTKGKYRNLGTHTTGGSDCFNEFNFNGKRMHYLQP